MTCAIADAIASVPLAALDGLSREVWQAHAAGRLDDDQAQTLAEAIHVRRAGKAAARAGQGGPVQLGRVPSIFPPKPRRQRPRDRSQSLERRRTIAASSPLPPHLAARYTTGQLAALGIIADELAAGGRCVLSIAEIAARAGISHRLAQATLRLAAADGLLVVTERPQPGRKHQTNLVRVLSREWAAWLAKRRPPGCRSLHPTENRDFYSGGRGPGGSRGASYGKEGMAYRPQRGRRSSVGATGGGGRADFPTRG